MKINVDITTLRVNLLVCVTCVTSAKCVFPVARRTHYVLEPLVLKADVVYFNQFSAINGRFELRW